MPEKRKERETHIRLTEDQRNWVLRRDNHECQFVLLDEDEPRRCKSAKRLEVHHIIPVDWGYELLKYTPEQVNKSDNLITLCREHHTRMIHPDYGILARQMYKFDVNSYSKIKEWHQALRKQGVSYWNTAFDEMLKIIARTRTWRYKLAHPEDTYPKGKQKAK